MKDARCLQGNPHKLVGILEEGAFENAFCYIEWHPGHTKQMSSANSSEIAPSPWCQEQLSSRLMWMSLSHKLLFHHSSISLPPPSGNHLPFPHLFLDRMPPESSPTHTPHFFGAFSFIYQLKSTGYLDFKGLFPRCHQRPSITFSHQLSFDATRRSLTLQVLGDSDGFE